MKGSLDDDPDVGVNQVDFAVISDIFTCECLAWIEGLCKGFATHVDPFRHQVCNQLLHRVRRLDPQFNIGVWTWSVDADDADMYFGSFTGRSTLTVYYR